MYRFFNANERGHFVNDCVVRAISIAENKPWSKTFNELSSIAQSEGILIDDTEFVDRYLRKKYPRVYAKGMSVGDFAKTHKKGVYLVTMEGHISCIIDGYIYDTFDCSSYKIWEVYKVEN